MVMENSDNKTKDLEQENVHPAPNADPGAEIETVIPSAEKGETPAESSTEPKEEAVVKSSSEPKEETSEQDQERVGSGDNADDIEPKDEGGESKTDEHGIETISP